MTDLATKIILDPPKADVVLVFSASWFVWAACGLLLVALLVAVAPKKPEKPKDS